MSRFRAADLPRLTEGRWSRPPVQPEQLLGVGIDTRENLCDRLFLAIAGTQHDGHHFLAEAAAAGAAVVVVEQRQQPRSLPPGLGVLEVPDTRRALASLADAHRRTLTSTTVIAITGSVGKTTAKELLHAALGTTLRGSAAPRSFNNDIGVPLTILAADARDAYLVLEIGTNAPGEIAALGAIARPDIAIITQIGRSHLEGLGSEAAVAREKLSLLDCLAEGGLAVLNVDVPSLRAAGSAAARCIGYGATPDADLVLTDRGPSGDRWWFEVNRSARFELGLPGRHNAINALAAVAVARHLGVDDASISAGLGSAAGPPMRLTLERFGAMLVYNDAYNANPESMAAALDAFAELTADAPSRVLVLGDMLELGGASDPLHRELAEKILAVDRRAPIERVHLIGEHTGHTAAVLREAWGERRVNHWSAPDETALAAIALQIDQGDQVLLKGSRGLALERLLAMLAARHQERVRVPVGSTSVRGT